MAYDEEKSQARDVLNGDYAYPGLKPYCPGEPALQCFQEAVARKEERAAYRKNHPGEYGPPNEDWEQHMRDHEYMDRAQELLFGRTSPRTFEPGDAFVPHHEEEK